MNALFEWLISIISEFKFWVIVQPWERAVRTRRGKNAAVLSAGIHWRVPIVDLIQTLNSRTRTYPFPSMTLITRDRQPVTVGGIVVWSIADPLQMHLATAEPHTLISAVAQAAASEYITSRDYAECHVAELNEHIAAQLAADTAGITFECVSVTEFGAFRTLRLLQESWRPYTGADQHA